MRVPISISRFLMAFCMFALFISSAAFAEAATKGGAKLGRDLTETYARAADAERMADPELGGIAIRLLREDQQNGGLIQTAYAERGFVVYTPREAQGEMIANARLYGLGIENDGLPDKEIARAEKFDVIMDEAGTFLRYRIKDAPPPTGATREWKMIVAYIRDPTPFTIPPAP